MCSDLGVVTVSVSRTLGFCSALVLLVLAGAALPRAAHAEETVMVCDIYGNHVVTRPPDVFGIRTSDRCPGNAAPAKYSRAHPPGGLAIWTVRGRKIRSGEVVRWTIRPPNGLEISSVDVPHMYSSGINNQSGWTGGLFWRGGSGGWRTSNGQSGWSSANSGSSSFRWPSRGTRYFGWRLACRGRRCRKSGHQWISLELLELHVRETRRPQLIAPDGLWRATGWIRGWWALHFYGDSPTGLCATGSTLNGQAGPGSVSARDSAVWHQCNAGAVDQPVDTSQYGQGVLPLTLTTMDAAGESVTYTRTVQVDNQAPTISLSGPSGASTTAGTQYVRATAAAGPSGVAGIACSVDGAAAHWYASSSAAVPVSGMGMHHVACYSENNARDASGVAATSTPATWTLNIRTPSVSTLSFVRVADALRCVHRRERVWIPGHWVTAYHRGHRVRVRIRGHGRRVEVMHCHPRTVRRRRRRHGRWVTTRVALLPHKVAVDRLRVRFGKGAPVMGWLGTPSGDALARQTVRILVAPNNGANHYHRVAVARTGADGVWHAHLPPGPAREVIAVYGGSSTAEPSVSKPAHLVVHSAIRLHIQPRRTRWGRTVLITGKLRGGYIPPAGEIVVLWVRWRGGSTETGHLYVKPNGAFRMPYKFRRGAGAQKYAFWAVTLRETDYPYAPGRVKSDLVV